MKNYFPVVVILFLCLFFSAPIQAFPVSNTDLWDVSQGTVVTGSSALHPSAGRFGVNMFGGGAAGNDRYNEGDNTIFVDGKPAGFDHWIEWETSASIRINSFNLVASHGPIQTLFRAISGFKLFNWDGTDWNCLYTYTASNPYGGGITYTESNYLELTATFPTVNAQKFRAVFTQLSAAGGNTASGPRIHELDGYYTVPVPATGFLFSIAVLGFAGIARKKNQP